MVIQNSTGELWLVYLHKDSFKYEDLCIAALMFEQDKLLLNFGLKSGYQHVDIYPDHLGFQWGNKDSVCYYMLTILPFRLSTAHIYKIN